MTNINFHREVCTGCGLCAKVCGSQVIGMEDRTPQQRYPTRCCSCGHCAALCPVGAITANPTGNPRAFQVGPPETGLGPVELLLRKKRSIREFKPVTPEREMLARLIAYAEKAPSSANNRRRLYVVVTDRAQLRDLESAVMRAYQAFQLILNPVVIGALQLFNRSLAASWQGAAAEIQHLQAAFRAGQSPIFQDAPCAIFIAAPRNDIQAQDDCVIALQYMMLYAETQGLGSCVNGYAQYVHGAVAKQLHLPPGYDLYAAGIFGYPQYHYKNEIRYLRPPEIIWR